jgi:hypothetical protein
MMREGSGTRARASLMALSSSLALAWPGVAIAEESAAGVGAFLGLSFGSDSLGKDQTGFEWGLEGFVTLLAEGSGGCEGPSFGYGPLLQFSQSKALSRFTFGAQVGGPVSSGRGAFSLEVGPTFGFGEDRWGLHLGAVPQYSYYNLYLRPELFLGAISAGAGARYLPTYGIDSRTGCATVGRPLRGADGRVVRSRSLEGRTASPRPTRHTFDSRHELAGQAWDRDACDEAASVTAFVALALELEAVNAPVELVERAIAAAADEVRHAAMCATLASHYLGKRVHPVVPKLQARPPLSRSRALERLARESFVDGCVGEGAAAEMALHAARRATDPLAAGLQGVIARDERRHAELAWSVLEWVLAQRDPRVLESMCHALDTPFVEGNEDARSIEELGRLGAAHSLDVRVRNHLAARRRAVKLLDALDGRHSPGKRAPAPDRARPQ